MQGNPNGPIIPPVGPSKQDAIRAALLTGKATQADGRTIEAVCTVEQGFIVLRIPATLSAADVSVSEKSAYLKCSARLPADGVRVALKTPHGINRVPVQPMNVNIMLKWAAGEMEAAPAAAAE